MLNHITIMGRLTRDPELKRTGSGVAVTSFTVAVERDFVSRGADRETDYIDCIAWRQTGEFVSKHFSKDRMIVVSGRLQIRNWTDKDGNKRRNAEVVADNCYFGDSKRHTDNVSSGHLEHSVSPVPPLTPSEQTYEAMKNGTFRAPAADFTILEDDDAQLPHLSE